MIRTRWESAPTSLIRRSCGRRAEHATALTIATDIGDRYEQARAHHGLARVHHTTGDPGQAHRHWQQALLLYTELGVPDVKFAKAQLADLEAGRSDAGRGPGVLADPDQCDAGPDPERDSQHSEGR